MKNSIMIVSPKDESSRDFKKQDIQELYSFMTLVQGNHRNCIYIKCQHGIEYMMVADRDARPILFPIKKFYEMTGVLPQTDEFIGSMSYHAFEAMYARWLNWNTESKDECGVCSMYQEQIKKVKTEV